jgi:predicted transcriptional regulator
MPQTVTFTLRIPKVLKKDLEDLSEATDRPQTYILTQALTTYVEAQRWQVEAIREAVRKADSPRAKFIPHDEVVARIKKLATKPKRAAG